MLEGRATAGSGLIFLACFWAVIGAAAFSVQPILEGRLSLRTTPVVGMVIWLVVALPSLLQTPYPGLYEAWHRSALEVLDDAQWWRVATALVVQDGGIAGTISNLILLAVALLACLPLWGARATVLGAVVTSAAAIVLIVVNDGHGIAVLVGLLLGFLGMPYARWRVRAGLLPPPIDPPASSS